MLVENVVVSLRLVKHFRHLCIYMVEDWKDFPQTKNDSEPFEFNLEKFGIDLLSKEQVDGYVIGFFCG